MRITSTTLELRILRTLTSTRSAKRLAKLTDALNPGCFYSAVGAEVYRRVMTLARERGVLTKWEELLEDPVLRETTRKRLQAFKKRPLRDAADITGSLKQLHSYRRLRAIYFGAEYAIQQLNRDQVDADKLYMTLNEKLTEAQADGNASEWFTHIGQEDKSAKQFVRQLLNNKIKQIYIPTGIAAFDSRSMGIPRGSFWLIGSNTSGGKSVLANQIGGNMAEAGARVCVVQLEMSRVETGQRHVSRITRTNMGRIIDPSRLSLRQKFRIEKQWLRWNAKIKRGGGLLSIFAPEEDLSLEEILLILKPFDYDVILVDYIGLLKGVDEVDYPRLLGRVARLGKRYAMNNNCVVAACAQLSIEGILRYSRQMGEHAQNMWIWVYGDKERESRVIEIKQPKSRNQKGFRFLLREDFAHMQMRSLNDREAARYDKRQQTNGKSAPPAQQGARRFNKARSQKIVRQNDFIDLAA